MLRPGKFVRVLDLVPIEEMEDSPVLGLLNVEAVD
jgi:hypothetical protein